MKTSPANDMLCYIETGGQKGSYLASSDAKLSATDMGVTYGRAVYEVVGVYNGGLIDYKGHEDRLKRSMQYFAIPQDIDFANIKKTIYSLLEKNEVTEGAVKILITRGDPGKRAAVAPKDLQPTIMLSVLMHFIPTVDDYDAGIPFAAIETNWARGNRTIKTTSMPDNSLANETAFYLGAKEALYVVDGKVTEGGSSNPFYIKDGVVYTHPADNQILHGTVRAKFIEFAKSKNIRIVEKASDLEEWLAADAVFTCSTTKWGMLGTGIFVSKSESKALPSGTEFGKNDIEFKQIKPTAAAMETIHAIRAEYIKFALAESEKEKKNIA